MLKSALNTKIITHIWRLANIVPIPKPNKDIDKDTSYRPISLLWVIAKTLEKSLLPYITGNITNTPTQHVYKTQHSTVTQYTYTHLSESSYIPTFQAHSLSSSQTTSRDAKPTQHIEITHPHVNLKLEFHKVASFHQHYSTYTLQTSYHHQEHQFRSWPTQTISPSHLHTQARVQPRNAYNYTYIKVFCLDKTKQYHTKSRQNNLHSVHSRPCIILEQSGPKYKNNTALRMASHPKVLGLTLDPKVLGLTLDPKLTYSTPIHTSQYKHTSHYKW